MRWRLWSLVCVVAMVSGCGGDEVVFTDPGAGFEVEVGDRFTVVLESNVTTGFSWQLERELPESLVTLVRERMAVCRRLKGTNIGVDSRHSRYSAPSIVSRSRSSCMMATRM